MPGVRRPDGPLRPRLHAAAARPRARRIRPPALLHPAVARERLGLVLPRPGVRGARRDLRGTRRVPPRGRAGRSDRCDRPPERPARRTPMTTRAPVPSAIDYLGSPLRVGEPDVAGPFAVFPLFGPEPRLAYRSFAQAAPVGVTVAETPGFATVSDLVVTNPTDLPVLLYEGEAVLGA